MISLLNRKVIPEKRLRYFMDPDYNISNTRVSRKDIFERKGCFGNSIYSHRDFIKYLIYFVEGAQVSNELYLIAKQILKDKDYSNDAIKELFKQIRSSLIEIKNPSEEIFKLVIDVGYELSDCIWIRNKIKSMR